MWKYPKKYDVIVIGAGHAGCEASFAASKKGARTLLLTTNLDTIAKLSCNPSIGGTAKGHIVREIDALGGIMAKIADKSAIHYRMLNSSKGMAVQSIRAQVDKDLYHLEMKKALENTENLEIKQHTVEKLIVKNKKMVAVATLEGVFYEATSFILCAGTFLKGKIFIGDLSFEGGRNTDKSCNNLASNLKTLGFKIGRLKTGTPPRIHKKDINFSKVEKQPSEKNIKFSFEKTSFKNSFIDCYITYTTEETKKIVKENIKKAALFSGKITGIGPRYCPSIEDKIIRFYSKERHQVFLEKEGLFTEEFYVNGISSSMPIEVQLKIIRSIKGLEKATIMRAAYAIEYDFIESSQLFSTLETRLIKNLFFAGQINGTTGYEEAAAQGMIAGINGSNKALKKPSFHLKRSESYIGVLIDDIITQEIKEPYRIFTSKAEHRLLLRHDNADIRLFEKGFKENLISKKRYEEIKEKKEKIERQKKILEKKEVIINKKNFSLAKILSRPDFNYKKLQKTYPKEVISLDEDIGKQIELEIKYKGYIKRQEKEVEKLNHLENIYIPKNFCFDKIKSLRNEAREKLKKFLPETLKIASKISGISPADISILLVYLQKNQKEKTL